jgi:hypothetical protein
LLLLDHIAQCTTPFVVIQHDGSPWLLPGASDFAETLRKCPLRYVLSDELVRTCTALGFSEGDEISGCLDLLHLPAEQLWIEWNESPRRAEVARLLPECEFLGGEETLRSGVLLRADPNGRSGTVNTFWLTGGARREALLAAMETIVSLDGGLASSPPEALFDGRAVRVADPLNGALDSVLECARFRFDPLWRQYYANAACDAATRVRLVQQSISAVAFDLPMLLALFLLQSVRTDLVEKSVCAERLNRKRALLGRPALLDHVELSAPVLLQVARPGPDAGDLPRRAPRLHHVRGHIVRRRNTVYWRGPHWRGHIRLGAIRTRTVNLRLQ